MKYENSLIYLINSCSKYLNMLLEQYFKNLDMGISATEHFALVVILEQNGCSQRDLARIILKDRANTGKLASTLEKKGLIKISLKTKNNRPVKILTITDEGKNLCNKIEQIIQPVVDNFRQKISENVINGTKKTIKNFREVVEKYVEINI